MRLHSRLSSSPEGAGRSSHASFSCSNRPPRARPHKVGCQTPAALPAAQTLPAASTVASAAS